MENCGNIFSSQSNRHRAGHHTIANNAGFPWDAWENNSSRFDWTRSVDSSILFTNTTAVDTASSCAPFFSNHGNWLHQDHYGHYHQPSVYAGERSRLHPNPHLMCLKLGKRHYFEGANNPGTGSDLHLPHGLISVGKRCKPHSGNVVGHAAPSNSAENVTAARVPKCQVEGCHVELVNTKDYHRRHKVCEMHSKAPKVMVLGLEQRFCQQCSRFHLLSEFDDSKRSCRRRLAGHNERRRKSSHDSVSRHISQEKFSAGRIPYLTSTTGCALSLLSSNTGSWISPSDIPSRSSAALHELIAEHRATIFARQLILEQYHTMEGLDEYHPRCTDLVPHQQQMSPGHDNSDQYHDSNTQVTLDLMQAPVSTFGLLSTRGKNDDECSQIWHAMEGARIG